MSRHTLKILKPVWRRCHSTHVCQMAAWIRDKFFWHYANPPKCFCTFAFRNLAQRYLTYLLEMSIVSWKILSLWVTQEHCQATSGRMLQHCLSAVSVQKEAPSHCPQSLHWFPVSTEDLPAPQATNHEAPYYFKLQLQGYRHKPCVVCRHVHIWARSGSLWSTLDTAAPQALQSCLCRTSEMSSGPSLTQHNHYSVSDQILLSWVFGHENDCTVL